MAVATSIPKLQRAFYTLGTLVLVMAILYWAQVVLVPIALAVLLAFIFSPATDWLEARGLHRVLSVLLVSLLAFAVLGSVLWVVAFEVRELATRLPRHQQTLSTKFAWLYGAGRTVRQGPGGGHRGFGRHGR